MLYKQPLQVGALRLKNRIVMPPMATGKSVNGAPGEVLVDYYRRRARGTGLVIVEHGYILPQGMAHAGQLSYAEDALIPAYRVLTEAVHAEGAKIIAQLSHAGAKAKDSGLPPVGPSPVAFKDGPVPRELTEEQIGEVIRAFASAALRARAAGFDGVEVHGAHGYLLNQFYSPLMNRREDEYSVRTMENRTRLMRQCVSAVRQAVGADYPVALRFGACDFLEGGSELRDIPAAVRALEGSGIDLLDVSGGMLGFQRPGRAEPGYLRDLGLAAKSAASVPVLITGGVTGAAELEELLRSGAGDLVGVGRALMKDENWSLRALED